MVHVGQAFKERTGCTQKVLHDLKVHLEHLRDPSD
jgi:hypothetical protein